MIFGGSRVLKQNINELFFLPDASIPRVLQKLKATLPISVLTNIKPGQILDTLKIPSVWFSNILQAGDYKEPKPALDGFKKILELSGLPPEEILYIGDSVVKDIRPAKSLGIKTCLVWSTSPEADWSCEKFEEILGIVG